MRNKIIMFLLLFFLVSTLSGCASEKKSAENNYIKITAKEAKDMIDQDSNIIILDVRTVDEFNAGHIKNAILIPDTEITENAEAILTDKTATILVYCRSGRRSALAAEDLATLDYTNVYDFGGIIDWEYDIVTE